MLSNGLTMSGRLSSRSRILLIGPALLYSPLPLFQENIPSDAINSQLVDSSGQLVDSLILNDYSGVTGIFKGGTRTLLLGKPNILLSLDMRTTLHDVLFVIVQHIIRPKNFKFSCYQGNYTTAILRARFWHSPGSCTIFGAGATIALCFVVKTI